MIKMLAFISLSGRYIDVCYPLHYSIFKTFHNRNNHYEYSNHPERKWAEYKHGIS